MSARADRIAAWLDDRLGTSKLKSLAEHKTVPMHRYSVFYYLGGMTLFFFLVQVVTGVLLMLYYRPGADEAFESVEFIMTTVPFGWLIRSLHSWSANLMVFFAAIHLVSVFFMKAYRAPREVTWVTGVLLLFLILGFGFSGYLLPWNQLAFFATKVGTDVAGAVPLVGEWIVRFLRGGDRVTGGTLSRFYGWHVTVLPALTLITLGIHLLLVQTKGMSVPGGVKTRGTMKFFPHFALRDLSGWVFALGVLAALAALFPWELGEKADLFAPAYEDIRPEWYFMFMFQTLKLMPGGTILGMELEAIPLFVFGAGGLVLILVPFLDRKKSRLWTILGAASLAFVIAMTCWGYHSLVPLYAVVLAVLLIAAFGFITRGRTAAVLALLFLAGASAEAATSCTTSCHEDKKAAFAKDVHAAVSLSCHDCHGGNPDPKLADDMAAAMEGVVSPARADIPEFCGKCHSSAAYMKRFNPAARIDQVTEYWSSGHGIRLKAGNERVATCIDCHSVHGIKRREQPDSPVHATKVAQTCSRCHAQYGRWKVSVHAKALLEKGDLSAPTCNDCHGNHGAAPPGLESVSFVCGQCHTREAELFRASGKHRFTECVTCHENHGVIRATVAMLGALPDTPCAFCHEGLGPVAQKVAEPRKKLENYREMRARLLEAAAALNLKGDARFDWLVDRAQHLPTHKGQEFQRLFEKFRIGKTHYTYRDHLTGKDVAVPVRRCSDCHEDTTAAKAYVDMTRGLTSMIARSERILLAAHRGGVEVRKVRPALDSAVDSQIELETLVHTFALPKIEAKQKEGLAHAEAALVAGQHSLDELGFRRRGLWFALGVILLVLAALVWKIRML